MWTIFSILPAPRWWWTDNWMGWRGCHERIRWFRSFGWCKEIVERIENWRTGWGNGQIHLANECHLLWSRIISYKSIYRRTRSRIEKMEVEKQIRTFMQTLQRKRKVLNVSFVCKCLRWRSWTEMNLNLS